MSDGAEHQGGVIVVGVDGSEASREALRWAGRQALLTGSTLRAVMAWRVPMAAYGAAVPLPEHLDLEGDCRVVVDRLVSEALGDPPPVRVTTEVVEGSPGPELVRAAEDADLLVVGSRGHGALVGVLIGSVSEHCVAHAHCPVLVVRHGPPAAAAPGPQGRHRVRFGR